MLRMNKGKTSAKKAEEQDEVAGAAASSLPLFFKKPAVLDKVRHAEAGLGASESMDFARATNSLPVNAIEFIEAAKTYPIVFTAEEKNPMPVAIVGWEKENYFIDAEGKWLKGTYI